MVFEFTNVKDNAITMVHRPHLGPLLSIDVPFDDLPKWKVSKAKMPQICPAETAAALLPHKVPMAKEELSKLQATMALHEACEKHQVDHHQIAFAQNPMGLWTLQAIKKAKQLKLVPLGSLAKLKGKEPRGCILMEHGGIKWQIHPWKQYQAWGEDAKSQETLVPFWWCKSGSEQCNMEIHSITMTTSSGNVKIPVLTNTVAIDANQLLLYPKPEDNENMGGGESSQPKKKLKATK